MYQIGLFEIQRDAATALVKGSEAARSGPQALLRGRLIPLGGGSLVPPHAFAELVGLAERPLRGGEAVRGRGAKPFGRFGGILLRLEQQRTQEELRLRQALGGSFTRPKLRLLTVLGNTVAMRIRVG